MLESFHFLRPWCIIILPVIIIIIWKLTIGLTQTNPWHEQVSSHLKKFMIGGQNDTQKKGSHQQQRLLGLLLALLMLALLGPTLWKKQVSGIAVKPQVMIVVDQSLSMLADDVKPSRTTRATHLVMDLLDKMPDAAIGLIVYAGSEHPLVPITYTHDIIKQAIQNIDPKLMPSRGNNPIPALEAASLSLAGAPKSTLIWMTDDINDQDEKGVITQLKTASFTSIIIAVGTQQGAPIDLGNGNLLRDKKDQLVIPALKATQIQSIAHRAGAQFYDHKALYGSQVTAITSAINDSAPEDNSTTTDLQDLGYDQWEDLGPWLLIPAALLFASLFRKGFLFMLAFCLINPLLLTDAQAQRPDQQAWEAYQNQEYQLAATLSQDSLIQGAALYQQKDYAKAAQAFAKASKIYQPGTEKAIQAYYNLGNAFARTEQLDAAIGAYSQVLEWQKDHQDAIYNRALLEKLKQDNKQDSQSQDGQSQDSQSQDGQSQDSQSQDSQSQDSQSQDGQSQDGQQKTQAQQQAQQQALEKALEAFEQQENQEKAEADAKAADPQDEAQTEDVHENTTEDNSSTMFDKPSPQVENHHLEAMELQPSGVLRNKMIRQYQQQRLKQQLRGSSDNETW